MNEQLFAVRQRRGELLAKIAAQREQAAQTGARLQAPLAIADQGLAALRSPVLRPVLVTGLVVLVAWRRRSLSGLLKTGLKLWTGKRYLSALLTKWS